MRFNTIGRTDGALQVLFAMGRPRSGRANKWMHTPPYIVATAVIPCVEGIQQQYIYEQLWIISGKECTLLFSAKKKRYELFEAHSSYFYDTIQNRYNVLPPHKFLSSTTLPCAHCSAVRQDSFGVRLYPSLDGGPAEGRAKEGVGLGIQNRRLHQVNTCSLFFYVSRRCKMMNPH